MKSSVVLQLCLRASAVVQLSARVSAAALLAATIVGCTDRAAETPLPAPALAAQAETATVAQNTEQNVPAVPPLATPQSDSSVPPTAPGTGAEEQRTAQAGTASGSDTAEPQAVAAAPHPLPDSDRAPAPLASVAPPAPVAPSVQQQQPAAPVVPAAPPSSATAPAAAPPAVTVPEATPEPARNTVLLSITGDKGAILEATDVEISGEESVIAVLQRTTRAHKIQMESRGRGRTAYVEGIDNLYEFDRGAKSGWLFRVNGQFPGTSAGAHTLQPGDKIEWLYTLDLGKDVGKTADSTAEAS